MEVSNKRNAGHLKKKKGINGEREKKVDTTHEYRKRRMTFLGLSDKSLVSTRAIKIRPYSGDRQLTIPKSFLQTCMCIWTQ